MNHEQLFVAAADLAQFRVTKFHEDNPNESVQPASIEDLKICLSNMVDRPIEIPEPLPSDPDEAMNVLRNHFGDDIALVSGAMALLFPDRYMIYRPDLCDIEIVYGLNMIREDLQRDPLPFDKVGRKSMERYLSVNDFLQWIVPENLKSLDRHLYLSILVYDLMAPIYAMAPDRSRYWFMATRPNNWQELDENDGLIDWSGKKDMRPGDIVFMYRTSPRMAITDISCVHSNGVYFDPFDYWGVRVPLEYVIPIAPITFRKLNDDPILRDWSAVRRRFQGVITEPIPFKFYNRLLELMSFEEREAADLKPELLKGERSGEFKSESEFEDQVIDPLLRMLDFVVKRQHECKFYIGAQIIPGRVDYLVADSQGPLTVFENKVSIVNDRQLEIAMRQARSYALLLGTPSFAVAAPEGLWLYSLQRQRERLEQRFDLSEQTVQQVDELRTLLRKLGKTRVA